MGLNRANDALLGSIEATIKANPTLTLRELADKSGDLFGTKLTYSWFKTQARERNWMVQQEIAKATNKTDNSSAGQMVNSVMQIVFMSIKQDWEEEHTLNPAKVNAFMNLMDKANVDITQIASAKTPQHQILDMLKSAGLNG